MTLIVKSRFVNIGVDVSYQFDPTYMSYMVNKIIQHIDVDPHFKKRSMEKTKKLWTKKINTIYVAGVIIKVKLRERTYDSIFSTKFLTPKNQNFISPKDSQQWLTQNIVGELKIEDLDKQRNCELDQADMLTHQSIIYHTESILET